MSLPRYVPFSLLAAALAGGPNAPAPEELRKVSIAHRGASAYAPEHTLAAYRLAIEQGADYVEQDLGLTKDGVLVCLHDVGLERTTDVARIFPDRAVETARDGRRVRTWPVHAFTLAEIRRLDAGSWFDAKFAGERVPTWEEAVALVRGHAGLYPEIKSPDVYRPRGIELARVTLDTIRRQGFLDGDAVTRRDLILQSFDEMSLKMAAAEAPGVPRVFLIAPERADRWLSPDGMRAIAGFATGIGPDKRIVTAHPQVVAWAHGAGLDVTPYTFRAGDTGAFKNVREEMRHFLFTLGVDALFTDNPDQFPR
jgi:glycerophosphoryl diester phosphodiesterase